MSNEKSKSEACEPCAFFFGLVIGLAIGAITIVFTLGGDLAEWHEWAMGNRYIYRDPVTGETVRDKDKVVAFWSTQPPASGQGDGE